MFDRILIANRGEIACRILRTAHRLGVSTVAVYSDADAGALHVSLADTAVWIGPAQVSESYLRADRIIEAALATGAEAIHPGYGFLSENPEFVEAVEEAGLVFIGPSPHAIRSMGLKDAAKTLMEAAGVPVVPGYHGARQEDAFLAARAAEIGYPVLIKAVAGGGGKGMRRVDRAADFADLLASARGEALSAFGNDAVLIEKYITRPRHIEVQVFGDEHGNAVHLFERDCSLQRRHQKVIEEAPAPGMTAELRAAMGAAAVRAARTIGYSGAGTLEFIVDDSEGLRPDGFWFMEMNTRLQVEHPVTEAITGIDLVEWQLRVASGEPLPLTQDQITLTGHAFEARLYAEDPARGFLPATGTLTGLRFLPGIRADSGVRAGDTISLWYDPMIAKIVSHGPTRETARATLTRALGAARVAGLVTNLAFLFRLSRHADFAAGLVDTGLIERSLEALTQPGDVPPAVVAVAALGALDLLDARGPLTGFTLWAPLCHSARLLWGGEPLAASVTLLGPGEFDVSGMRISVLDWDGAELSCEIGGTGHRFGLMRGPAALTLFHEGEVWSFHLPDPLAAEADMGPGGDDIRAPMPGLVKSIATVPGATVAAGDVLMVLEAMKMEHGLTAPRDGVVAEILTVAGAQVVDGTPLLTLEPLDG